MYPIYAIQQDRSAVCFKEGLYENLGSCFGEIMTGNTIGKPGPFQIIDGGGCGAVDGPVPPPKRRYSCPNYQTCLDLAAALNWDNFTCRGCNAVINEALYWRAYQAVKKDAVVRTLCELPAIKLHKATTKKLFTPKVAAKR